MITKAIRWIKYGVVGASMLVSWVVASAAIMAITEKAPGALILWPARDLQKRLPDHVRILDWRAHRVLVTSDQPGYVRQLYASGASLVLPARKNGCLSGQKLASSLPGKAQR